MTVTKAYKNPDFLMGDDAREVRVLCEYLEPRSRLKRAGIQRGITFFGSARVRPGENPDYYALASAMGCRLARWTRESHPSGRRYHLCTGGGPGVMEAVARGVAEVDRRLSVGFNISLPHEQHANPYLDPDLTFEFHYFFMRKFWFANLSQAVVVFPGGLGTLDELFEILTLIQTCKMGPRPIVLFGREFWSRILHFDELVERGLIDAEDVDRFRCEDDVTRACEFITNQLAENPASAPEALA